MPQARKIEPFVHGEDHLKPGVGSEMERWRPEQFATARTFLASCEACQACLFDASGENAEHLNEGAVAAIARNQVDQKLSLVTRHLRECTECALALFYAEGSASKEENPQPDFNEPPFPSDPIEEW